MKKVIGLFRKVKAVFPETETIVIYGELFGGGYKHKDIEPVKGAVKVQKGLNMPLKTNSMLSILN